MTKTILINTAADNDPIKPMVKVWKLLEATNVKYKRNEFAAISIGP